MRIIPRTAPTAMSNQPARAMKVPLSQQSNKRGDQQDCRDHAGERVQQHHNRIENIGLGEGVEVKGRDHKEWQQPRKGPTNESLGW